MFRKKLFAEVKQQPDPIRRRGEHVSRLEAFSDAVFAFYHVGRRLHFIGPGILCTDLAGYCH